MPDNTPTKRRSGTETRKKSIPVTTRYDEAELAQLDELASRAGLTRASYQRVQTLSIAPKTRSTRRAPMEREALAKILGQLGKIGSNLNQLAHMGHLGQTDRAANQMVLSGLQTLLPHLMAALGRK